MPHIKDYQVFKDEGKAGWGNGKLKNGLGKEDQKIIVHFVLDWLLMVTSTRNQWIQSTQELSHSEVYGRLLSCRAQPT